MWIWGLKSLSNHDGDGDGDGNGNEKGKNVISLGPVYKYPGIFENVTSP